MRRRQHLVLSPVHVCHLLANIRPLRCLQETFHKRQRKVASDGAEWLVNIVLCVSAKPAFASLWLANVFGDHAWGNTSLSQGETCGQLTYRIAVAKAM